MKARAPFDLDGVPVELRRFDPADWPGSMADRYTRWVTRRFAWCADHRWPGGPVDLIRQHRDVRLALVRAGHIIVTRREPGARR